MAAPRRSAGVTSSSGYADVAELEKYKLVSNIGKGSFGVISKVQRVSDGKEFALKQLDYSKMTEKDRKQILAEVAILDSLKHRNIVQLIQKIKDPKNERIYIVMEYCTSGDLGTLIRRAQRNNSSIPEDKIWNIFLQIVLALHHCHWPAERSVNSGGRQSVVAPSTDAGVARYQVLHRDLKPENVFLSDEFVKLGDFGLSKEMGTASFTSTYVGTPLYMPPEILAENRYDTKSDIWSLGCLVYEMCALHSPFSAAQTQPELITMVKSGKIPPLPARYSPALRSAIKAMLTLNPTKRPSTKDLLEMSEMKLHRKLFTVQNQTSLLFAKRDELKQFEDQIRARAVALDEREKELAGREASLQAREDLCENREEEAKETQRKLNQAAESLRGQWGRFREEKEQWEKYREQEEKAKETAFGVTDLPDEKCQFRTGVTGIARPPLAERNTAPASPVSRFTRTCFDTPSKIPLATAAASPAPLEARFGISHLQPRPATPMRRAATKSMGNLAGVARAQAAQEWTGVTQSTPAKQFSFPIRQQRTSIGSPSELQSVYCEDVSMISAIPSPWVSRPRKSSVAPSIVTGQQEGPDSGESFSTANSRPTSLAPTQIPAPTFTYREAATPAKWSLDDPDLPSPFIRRPNSMPIQPQSASFPPSSNLAEMRQPLGSINPQPTINGPSATLGGPVTKKIPSRSGNLHQHVLKVNAARVSGEGIVPSAAPVNVVRGRTGNRIG
ncbi:NEK protein kinase [Cryptococcus gattii Ru294]|nr:NEK protein kinase [Cryptococcus gattii Ru294]